jgi:hypothetical protein
MTHGQLLNVQGYRWFSRKTDVAGKPYRSELAITLWGVGDQPVGYKTTVSNADLYFVSEEEAKNSPAEYSETCQRIRVFCPLSHLPVIMRMLQTNQGVRCFYYEYDSGFKEGGLKDWVTKPGK